MKKIFLVFQLLVSVMCDAQLRAPRFIYPPDKLSDLSATTSAELATVITNETGTGNLVYSNDPTFVAPVLGTPASGNLANCTFPTLNQNTSGTAAGLSATLAIGSGGTGQTSASAAFNALAPSKTGNSLKYLRVNTGETDYELVTLAGGGDMLAANNLSDVSNVTTARNNLGVVNQIVKNLGTDLTSSSTTMVKATNLDQTVGAGTWVFEYHIMWQTTATATAIKLGVNHSGTVTRFVAEATGFEGTTTASTGAQTSTHAAFGLRAGGQNNAISTTVSIFGPTSVITANVDHYTVIRGMIVVTVSGDLQLYFGSEATGSTQTLELPTSLILTRIL